MAKRSLVPHGGNDRVMTPRLLAKAIIEHYKPDGYLIDPCRGDGAFYDQFPDHEDQQWKEITEGRDFLQMVPLSSEQNYTWCMSNPPYSLFRAFTHRAMQVADNVVWLAPINHFWLTARLRDMDEAGFAIREIARVKTPPKPWPQSGFALGAVHLQRGYTGDIKRSTILY